METTSNVGAAGVVCAFSDPTTVRSEMTTRANADVTGIRLQFGLPAMFVKRILSEGAAIVLA